MRVSLGLVSDRWIDDVTAVSEIIHDIRDVDIY